MFSLLPVLPLLVCGVEFDEKDDASMLQVMGQVKSGLDVQWHDLVHSESESESSLDAHDGVFPVYLDFKTMSDVHRERFPAQKSKELGTPYEMAFRFKDLEKQGFVVNGTHAIFPMDHMVQAQFARKTGPLRTLEFGVVNMRWQPKIPHLPSAIEYVVASAEKVHILYHKGPWREESYKFALKDQGNQTDTDTDASDFRMSKTVAALRMTLEGRLGIQFMRAGTDPMDLASVETLSGKPAPTRFSMMSERLQRTLSRNVAKITRKVRRKDTPESTGNNCFHFMNSKSDSSTLPPVALTPDGLSGFAVRLDTLVQSFRGETTFAPLESSSFTRGGMVLSHDADAGELRVYHQSSSLFRAEDIDGTHLHADPKFYMGSLTSGRYALEPDARTSTQTPSQDEHELWSSYRAMPMDYKHMFTATCIEGASDGKYAKAKEAFASLNTLEFVRALGDTSIPLADRKKTLRDISEMMAEHADCWSGWLRSPIVNSHGFGFDEAAVIVHMMTEFLPPQLADIILDSKWNIMDLVHDGEEQ